MNSRDYIDEIKNIVFHYIFIACDEESYQTRGKDLVISYNDTTIRDTDDVLAN